MLAKEYCVYNETGENFLVPRVTAIDTRVEPLRAVKVLIEGLAPGAETGLWLNPLKSVPSVPRLSSYDLVYLDPQYRVLQAVTLGADDDVPRIDGRAASALVLPFHSFSASHTHPGDKVILHVADGEERTEAPSLAACAVADTPVVVAGLDLSRDEVLSQAPTAFEPTLNPVYEPQVLPPASAQWKDTSGIGLLRSIVHLRIHISVSISTSAPAATASTAAVTRPAELPGGVRPQTKKLVHGGIRMVRAAAGRSRAFFAGCSAACLRRCAGLKGRYLRWADVVVYGAPRVARRSAIRTMRRSPRLEEEC
jgi:hypothetical protein